ncbi:MAG: TA system VapC family ribonuclease toxin [Alkalispirochaeta sp.]
MRSLLDINVIIALLDSDHDFHHRAHAWWEAHGDGGWASCPLTENGVVRIMSHPAYNPRRPLTPTAVVTILRAFAQGTEHRFWPDRISLLDDTLIDSAHILGPRQVMDIYLLALATSHEGRLVTFDESVNHRAVPERGAHHLFII